MPEPIIFQRPKYSDNRGFFEESWNYKFLNNKNIKDKFVQQNHSYSKKTATIRGLHLQIKPHAQSKLIKCIKGKILDIVVDVRKGSRNFGKHKKFILSDSNRRLLYVPIGFLHGFLTLKDNTEVIYMCSNYYSQKHEISINFFDRNLGIKLPSLNSKYIISQKDKKAMNLNEFNSPFNYNNK